MTFGFVCGHSKKLSRLCDIIKADDLAAFTFACALLTDLSYKLEQEGEKFEQSLIHSSLSLFFFFFDSLV